jgi:hypothetical protein
MALSYVVFHPERYRYKADVGGRAIVRGVVEDWEGKVCLGAGSGDPYVLNNQWLYSFCHATQLRRKPSKYGDYVKEGSCIFFCNGDVVKSGTLQMDTVFVVDHVATWPKHGVPDDFAHHYKNPRSVLWRDHFQFGINGPHCGKYTFVGRQWRGAIQEFSFLPLDGDGRRSSFRLSDLSSATRSHIESNIRGKRPVLLDDEQKDEILNMLLKIVAVQVIELRNTKHARRQGRTTRALHRTPTALSCGRRR